MSKRDLRTRGAQISNALNERLRRNYAGNLREQGVHEHEVAGILEMDLYPEGPESAASTGRDDG